MTTKKIYNNRNNLIYEITNKSGIHYIDNNTIYEGTFNDDLSYDFGKITKKYINSEDIVNLLNKLINNDYNKFTYVNSECNKGFSIYIDLFDEHFLDKNYIEENNIIIEIIHCGKFTNNKMSNGFIDLQINNINLITFEISNIDLDNKNIKCTVNKKVPIKNDLHIYKKIIYFEIISNDKYFEILTPIKNIIYAKYYSIENEQIIYEGKIKTTKKNYYADSNYFSYYYHEYNGQGKLYYEGSLIYDGIFNDGFIFNKTFGIKYKCFTNTIIYFGKIICIGDIILKNGIGKEYNDNDKHNLLYKGEFINNIRSGKGKSYSCNGFLRYEGEFKNNMWHGKGKEYNDDGILIYDSEFSNNKIDGKGKKYNNKGVLIYDGEFKNNVPDGKGKYYNDEGVLIYEGEFKNDKMDGKGKYYNDEGVLMYEGEFKNDKMDGKIKKYNTEGDLIYEGESKNDKIHGKGKLYNCDGTLNYEGEFENDKKHGKGKYYKNNVLIYDGESNNDNIDGNGKYYKKNVLIYDGKFKNNISIDGRVFFKFFS